MRLVDGFDSHPRWSLRHGNGTSFVGRHSELDELDSLTTDRHLVTIIGAGGCGKTRLAQQLATQRRGSADNTAWVDLASIREPARALDAIGSALGALVPEADAVSGLTLQLREQDTFIVVDNCEHLRDSCGQLIDRLLRLCPRLRVLATSREPLGLATETVWRLPALTDDDAVALFVDRAATARPDLAMQPDDLHHVRTICRRLDGIPLAIELAARWMRVLLPAQIAERLDDRFTLLVGGPLDADARQQTLLASIHWSYGLLDDASQRMLLCLSVLHGDFDLTAAMAVSTAGDRAAADVLASLRRLADASLIEAEDHGGSSRFRLSETVRHFAADRLNGTGATSEVRDRHLAHFLTVAGRAASRWEALDEDDPLGDLETEQENLRAALEWAWAKPDTAAARTLTEALAGLWLLGGHAEEGVVAVRRALAAEPQDRSILQANLWSSLALLGMPSGHVDLIEDASQRALDIATGTEDDAALARAFVAGCYFTFFVDYERCEQLALAAQFHADATGAHFTSQLARTFAMISLGNRDRHDEALSIADDLFERSWPRHCRSLAAISRTQALYGALLTGDVPHAVACGLDGRRVAQSLPDDFITGTVTAHLAWALGVAGRLREAQRLIESLVRSVDRAGPGADVVDLRVVAGKLDLWSGQPTVAIDSLQHAAQFNDPGDDNWTAVRALPSLAAALRHAQRLDEAATAAQRGLDMACRLGTPHAQAESLDELAHLRLAHDTSQALDLFHEAIAVRRTRGLRTHLADSLDHLAHVASLSEDHEHGARLVAASDAARKQMGYPRPAIDQPYHDAIRHNLQAALGRSAYREATNDGGALDLDAALAYATRARGPRGRPSSGWASLTPTEQEITSLVAEGLTNPQIASRLFISRATVKTHLSHIFTKLDVVNRTELAAVATRRAHG